ncbi:MAG: exodeoxyribonuclease VII small subunit [Planctomycetes bacterium]|nr:exodeoxyribonuclease VII small subunit [Planctomycetota bacterium]
MGRERDAKAGGASGAGDDPAAGGEPDAVRYAAAVEEIEALLASIDRDEIDVDELAAKVERAVQLLKVCRAKLKATEARVVAVLKDLDADDAAAEAAGDAVAGAGDAAGGSGSGGSGGGSGADDAAAPRKRKRKKGDDDELPF